VNVVPEEGESVPSCSDPGAGSGDSDWAAAVVSPVVV